MVLYQHSKVPGRPEKQVVCTGRCGVLVDAGLPKRFSVELDGEAVGDPFVLAGLGPAARLRVQEVPRPSAAMKWAGGALIFGGLAAITVGVLTMDTGIQDSRKASSFIIDADTLIGLLVVVGGCGMLGSGIPVLVNGFRRTETVVELGVTGAFSPRFRGVALAPPLSFGGAVLPATISASWTF